MEVVWNMLSDILSENTFISIKTFIAILIFIMLMLGQYFLVRNKLDIFEDDIEELEKEIIRLRTELSIDVTTKVNNAMLASGNSHKRLEDDVRDVNKLINTNKDNISDKVQNLDVRVTLLEGVTCVVNKK